jgi:hypothetical protein
VDDARLRDPAGSASPPAVSRAALASVIGARYLAIGTGDTARYVFAGMLAAVVLSVRVFLVRGAGKAN